MELSALCFRLVRPCVRSSGRHVVGLIVQIARQTFREPGARFTKYLTTILRLSYDNAKVTIALRRTSNLQNILLRAQGFS